MPEPLQLPPEIRSALEEILGYFMPQQAADFAATPPEYQPCHIYPSLLQVRQWLDGSLPETSDVDTLAIHRLLEAHGYCAAIWCVEDVQAVRPDLAEDQCRKVLRECSRRHDATLGINWLTIECIAEDLFPPPE